MSRRFIFANTWRSSADATERPNRVRHTIILTGFMVAVTLNAVGTLGAQTPYSRLDLAASVDSERNGSTEETKCLEVGAYVLAVHPHDTSGGEVRVELQLESGPDVLRVVSLDGAPSLAPFLVRTDHEPRCADLTVNNARGRIYELRALVDWNDAN